MARSVPPPGGVYPRPQEEEPNEPQGKKRRIPRIVVPGLAAAAAAPTLGLVPAAAQEATAVPHLDPAPATPPINPASQPRVSVEAVRPTVEVRPVASTSSAEAAERANLLSFPAHITLANQSPLQGYYSSLELGSISSLGREGEFDVPLERLGGVATDSQLADYQSVYGRDNVIVNEEGGITFRAEVMPVRLKAGLGIIETLGLPDSVGMALAEMVGFSSPGTDTQMDGVFGLPVPVGTVEAYIQSQSNEQAATTRPANQTETRNQQNNRTQQSQPQNAESISRQPASEAVIPAGLEHERQAGNLTQEAVQVNQHIADVRTRLTSANERGDIELPDDSELAELNNNILSVIASGDINPREAEAYTVASIIRYNGRNITPDSLRDYAKIMVEDFEVTFENYSQPGTTTSMNPLISTEVRDLLRNSLAAGWEQILLPDEAKSSNSHDLLVFSNMSILESRLAEAIERRKDGQPLEAALLRSVVFYVGDERDLMPRIVQGMFRNPDIPRDVLDQELLMANPWLTEEKLDRPLPVGSTLQVPRGNPNSSRSYEDAIPRPNFSPEYTRNNPELVSRVKTMFRIMMYYRSQSDSAPQLGTIPILEKQDLVKIARSADFISSGGQLDVTRFTDRIFNMAGISRDEAVYVHEDLMRRIFNQAQEAGKLRLPDFVKPVVLAELAADRGLTTLMAERLVSRDQDAWINIAFSPELRGRQTTSDRAWADSINDTLLNSNYGLTSDAVQRFLKSNGIEFEIGLSRINDWIESLQGNPNRGINDLYVALMTGIYQQNKEAFGNDLQKALAMPVRLYLDGLIESGQIKPNRDLPNTTNENKNLTPDAVIAIGKLFSERGLGLGEVISRINSYNHERHGSLEEFLRIWGPPVETVTTGEMFSRSGLEIEAMLESKYGGVSGRLGSEDLRELGDDWPGFVMYPDAAVTFQMMAEAFEAEFGEPLELSWSYRSYDQQVEVREYWEEQGNASMAAWPGTSDHGWGLAFDAEGFESFSSAKAEWVYHNGPTYGWVRPSWAWGKGEFWHYEYQEVPEQSVIDAHTGNTENNNGNQGSENRGNHGSENRENQGSESHIRGFDGNREFEGATYTAPRSGQGEVIAVNGDVYNYPALGKYEKGSDAQKAIIRAAAALLGFPIEWAESEALHNLIDHESAGGWVGIPNYTYDGLYGVDDISEHQEVWPKVWEDIRNGVFLARSSATGTGQLLANIYENVQAHYPSGVEGIGIPIEEYVGTLSYIEGRYDNPEIAWDNHSANPNRYSMGDVRYESEGY